MKISIITTSLNSASTISECIDSVTLQTYSDIEHIIVDGLSKDNTLEIIDQHPGRVVKVISEPDKGMYDAMNKGIMLATGDVIGILNSDDFFFSSNVVEKIASAFQQEDVDAVYGDVRFVDSSDIEKTTRYYSSRRFRPDYFKYGIMPAHPSFYVRKRFYDTLGGYKDDYIIAGDFELLVRFLYKKNLSSRYLELPVVTMRSGGVSNKSIKSRFILNSEIIRACKENGIRTNYFRVYSKYFYKVFEYISRK